MPNWINEPPDGASHSGMRLIRTPATKTLTACVTSTEIVGCCTHFVGNRTVPCEGVPNCAPCSEGIPWRWHGYLSCLLRETLEHVLFEFTAASSDPFKHYIEVHGTLRGCKMTARRVNSKHNGRVLIQCREAELTRIRLPDPPDLKKMMCHIWNIPTNRAETPNMARPPFKNLVLKNEPGNGDEI